MKYDNSPASYLDEFYGWTQVPLDGWEWDVIVWCQNNFKENAWTNEFRFFWFRNKQDAMLFALRWAK